MRKQLLPRFLALAIVLAILPLSSAGPLSAALNANCAKCYNSSKEIDAHVFGEAGWFYPYEYMDCDEFNACHEDSQGGFCTAFHYYCPDSVMLLQEVRKSLAAGDAESLDGLMKKNDSLLKYDARSGTLAVLDCGKGLIEKLQVPEALRASLRA